MNFVEIHQQQQQRQSQWRPCSSAALSTIYWVWKRDFINFSALPLSCSLFLCRPLQLQVSIVRIHVLYHSELLRYQIIVARGCLCLCLASDQREFRDSKKWLPASERKERKTVDNEANSTFSMRTVSTLSRLPPRRQLNYWFWAESGQQSIINSTAFYCCSSNSPVSLCVSGCTVLYCVFVASIQHGAQHSMLSGYGACTISLFITKICLSRSIWCILLNYILVNFNYNPPPSIPPSTMHNVTTYQKEINVNFN